MPCGATLRAFPQSSGPPGVAPRPVELPSTRIYYKCRISGLTPEFLHQKVWGLGLEICVLISPSGDFDVHLKLRTTSPGHLQSCATAERRKPFSERPEASLPKYQV